MNKVKILKKIFGVLALGSLATTLTFSVLSSVKASKANEIRKSLTANVTLNQQIVDFEKNINDQYVNGEISKEDYLTITSTLHGEKRIDFYIKNYCTDQKIIDEYKELSDLEKKEKVYKDTTILGISANLVTGTAAYALSEYDNDEEIDEGYYSSYEEDEYYDYPVIKKQKQEYNTSYYKDDFDM